LSNDLQQIPASERNEESGADFLTCGRVIQEDGTWFKQRSGDFVINLGDVVNVQLTSDSHRLAAAVSMDAMGQISNARIAAPTLRLK
jgi:hypothetical protein